MDGFIGEIKIVGFDYAPMNWAFCNGQLLPIYQYTAVFAVLGTTFGGDGKTTFALPNFQGRAPMHAGSGPGLTPRALGKADGCTSVTLTAVQMPQHTHSPMGTSGTGAVSPENNTWGTIPTELDPIPAYQSGPPDKQMGSAILGNTGGGMPHSNLQPYLAVNFVICLFGLFPVRE